MRSKFNVGAIVGGVVGSILFVIVLIVVVTVLKQCRKREHNGNTSSIIATIVSNL